MTPEGAVKAKLLKVFKRLLAWSYAPVQNGMGVVGIPDRIACVPIVVTPDMVGKRLGLFVAVEAKAPGKKHTVTANQQKNLDGIVAAGGIAIVAESAEELEACLSSHGINVSSSISETLTGFSLSSRQPSRSTSRGAAS